MSTGHKHLGNEMRHALDRKRANIAPGQLDPLSFAIEKRDSSTIEMVREALLHRQTLLAFQPIMRANDPSQVAFYEGLIRVLDPTGRVIPAKDFIEEVEDTELGRELDVQALRMGLNALRLNPGLRISINMSARSIGYRPWMQTLNRALSRDGTIGERLILEITETSAMTVPELVTDFMNRLQPKGICFAMDDFGAGFTAIRYFKDFYFDVLKLDGQFVRNLSQDPDNQCVIRALVSIAQHFDMLTVAECVENEADAQVLIDMGVDCLQGYHYGAPTTRPAWIRDGAAARKAG